MSRTTAPSPIDGDAVWRMMEGPDRVAVLDRAVDVAAQVWRAFIGRDWFPMEYHRCAPGKCSMHPVPFRVFRCDGATTVAHQSPTTTPAALFTITSQHTRVVYAYHVCVRGSMCDGATPLAHHHREVVASSRLSMCARTGHEHRCGDACFAVDTAAVTAGGGGASVCALTGVTGDVEMRTQDWNPSRRIHSRACARVRSLSEWTPGGRNSWHEHTSASARVDATLERIFAATTSREILAVVSARRARAQTLREEYMLTACAKVAMLVSPQRMEDIDTRHMESNERLIAGIRDYYRTSCRQRRVPVLCDALVIAANYRMQRPDVDADHVEELPDEVRRAVVVDTARKCVRLWYVMRTRTAYGRDTERVAQRLPFWRFIDVAVHMLAEGFELSPDVDGGGTLFRTVLIDRDPLLARYAMNNNTIDAMLFDDCDPVRRHAHQRGSVAANTLTVMRRDTTGALVVPGASMNAVTPFHTGGAATSVLTSRRPYDNVTKLATAVKRALRDAVRGEGVSPMQLRLDSVQFDECDERHFVAMVRPRVKPQRRR